MESQFWTVNEILDRVGELGLPHFQRGRVWKEQHRSLLLESLYWGTPCGTLLLWSADAPERFGKPLLKGGQSRWLLLDGQQRVTTLRGVFGDLAGSGDAKWCLDLALEPTTRELYTTRSGTRSLFVLASPDRDNLVPVDAPSRPAELPQATWAGVLARLEAMREQKFLVVEPPTTGIGEPHAEMVALYNRINSAGVAVRGEERAYAAMVGLSPRAADWIAALFRLAHPLAPDAVDERNAEAREWMERERERRFGFGLFVRTFVQTVGHHRDHPSLDFADLEQPWIRDHLVGHPKDLQFVFDQAEAAISAVISAVRSVVGLDCDDLRCSPPIDAIRLAVQFCLKYPDAPRWSPGLVPALLLAATLADRGKEAELPVQAIRQSNTLGEAIDALPWPRIEEVSHLLGKAQSTNARALWPLYWLLRRRRAPDPISPSRRVASYSSVHVDHVAPYSRLKATFGLETRRPGTHDVHRIGNLTWLPGGSNDKKAASWLSGSLDAEVLRAHLLLEPGQDVETSPIQRAYSRMRAAAKEGKPDQRDFVAFEWARRQLMAEALHGMARELEEAARAELRPYRGASPAAQRIKESAADRIRARARDESWPPEVVAEALQISLRPTKWQAGKWWALARAGTDREPTWQDFQLRLKKDFSEIRIGPRFPRATSIREGLVALGLQGQSGSQNRLKLDPTSSLAAEALRSLVEEADR